MMMVMERQQRQNFFWGKRCKNGQAKFCLLFSSFLIRKFCFFLSAHFSENQQLFFKKQTNTQEERERGIWH